MCIIVGFFSFKTLVLDCHVLTAISGDGYLSSKCIEYYYVLGMRSCAVYKYLIKLSQTCISNGFFMFEHVERKKKVNASQSVRHATFTHYTLDSVLMDIYGHDMGYHTHFRIDGRSR